MKYFLLFFFFLSLSAQEDLILKDHEKWWAQECVKMDQMETFASWIGTENELSRVAARKHIIAKKYQSLLDVPCGLCIEYPPLKNSGIEYLGVDITSFFIDRAANLNIPVKLGRIQNIPCPDCSFDIVYARHILEHLDYYEQAMRDLIRVAKKEVLIIFFIIPHSNPDVIRTGDYVDGLPIYHNRYSKPKMEAFLKSYPRVKSFEWTSIPNTQECMLHILIE